MSVGHSQKGKKGKREKGNAMIKLLMWIGRIVGLVGFGAAATAVLLRTMGQWRLGELQIGTLLQAGVAAMVLAALAYVAALAERSQV